MKRGWLAGLCLATALHAGSGVALAQRAARIELDDEDDAPVTAGPMTEEAARVRALFDAGRWADAAPRLQRVVAGDTLDDQGNRQIAQYHLAVALHRLGLPVASFGVLSIIAGDPRHLRFEAALPWLAALAQELPEPSAVIERIGRYRPEHVARVRDPETAQSLHYLLGRARYRSGKYEEAIERFEKVGPRSKHYLEAQFFMGTSYVHLRKAAVAVRAFRRMADVAGEGRMRDLASMSIARTYYTTTISGSIFGGSSFNARALSNAVKEWNLVDPAGPSWADALLEVSWAYFWAGDYPHVLGNLATIQSPYFEDRAYPEADILRATLFWGLCDYDRAITSSAQMRLHYEPIRRELATVIGNAAGDGGEARLLRLFRDVRARRASVSPPARPVFETALADRELDRHVALVRFIEEEIARLAQAHGGLLASPLGAELQGALEVARDEAAQGAGALVRARLVRADGELGAHIASARQIMAESAFMQRELRAPGATRRRNEHTYGVVRPDVEHTIWPFDGEYWRDELGSYRVVVTSKCGRQ